MGEDHIWPRHVIDDSSRGADGVRLHDVNGDGRLDIATGWEEGNQTKVYLNPGPEQAAELWPSVVVGETPSVEDAVFCDLDGDGAFDVVSCCEGERKAVLIHWAPAEIDRYLDPDAWETAEIPAVAGLTAWMFALPMDIDQKNGIDLVVGSREPNAIVGWLESPPDPRDLSQWKLHRIYAAGWILSASSATGSSS